MLLQALEIIFEMYWKTIEKITRRKLSFPTYETHFFPTLFF